MRFRPLLYSVCSLVVLLTASVSAQSNSIGHAQLIKEPAARISPPPSHVNRFAGQSPQDSGAFVFLPAVTYAAGQYPDGVAVADVNGDGRPDLVVANGCLTSSDCNSSAVSVLLGNGDGTFQSAVIYNTGEIDATSIAVGDLNGDGHPDIVVANGCEDGICAHGGLSVLLGKGDGTFQSAATYSSGGTLPSSVVIGDVNGDGHSDLVVANWQSHSVGVLLGNGDGTFQAPVTYDAGFDPDSVVTGDVNGDGHPDLVLADLCLPSGDCSTGGVSVLLGKGDGTFQARVTYSSGGAAAFSAAIGDVNGDGHPDLVVGNLYYGIFSNGGVGVLLGNGDGTFQDPATYDAGPGGNSVEIADTNGDGHPDLVTNVAVNRCNGICSGEVSLMLGNGDGTFPTLDGYPSGGFTGDGIEENGNAPNAVAIADVNGDGSLDVLAVNSCGNSDSTCSNGGTVGVLLNNSAAPATITALVSSVNPVDLKKVVTYTATVSRQSGGTVNGAVTFTDGISTLATVTLVNNQATYSTSYVRSEVGAHPITAAFPGTLHEAGGSQSAVLTESVRDATTKTTVSTSGSPSFAGQPVTFTATVASKSGSISDGELVTFYDGPKVLGSVGLAGGKAAYTTAILKAGNHVIKATYGGDNTFEPSSGTVKQRVELSSTTTTLTSSPNPSHHGQAVTLTATVISAFPGTPTGTVTFKNGSTTLGKGTLDAGTATLTTSKLPVGTLTITATYNGDADAEKSSGTTTQTVD